MILESLTPEEVRALKPDNGIEELLEFLMIELGYTREEANEAVA